MKKYLIKEKNQAEQIKEELDSIIESSESLLSLLDETLASAKVTEAESLIVNDYFNLDDVLRSAVNLVKPSGGPLKPAPIPHLIS